MSCAFSRFAELKLINWKENEQQPNESSKSNSSGRVYRGKQSSQEQRKADKENFIEDLAKEAEAASAQGNMKQLYDITRKLAVYVLRNPDFKYTICWVLRHLFLLLLKMAVVNTNVTISQTLRHLEQFF